MRSLHKFAIALAALLTMQPSSIAAAAAPEPLTRAEAEYPAAAEASGAIGKASARLTIDNDGAVVRADLISEIPEGLGFGDAALAAARRWTFKPGKPGTFVVGMTFQPPPNECGVLTASVVPRRPIKRIPPEYPAQALYRHVQGRTVALAEVDSDGAVSSVSIISETPRGAGFGRATVETVQQWQFGSGNPGPYCVVQQFQLR